MCIIAHGLKRNFPEDELKQCLKANSAGTFLAVIRHNGDACEIADTIRTVDNDEIVKKFEAIGPDDEILLHARIPSRGSKCLDNVHGWVSEEGIRFCHNGTMTIDSWQDHTDSETFFRKIFLPCWRGEGRQFTDNVEFVIKQFISTNSKVAFLMPDGTVRLYGNYVKDHDMEFSNSSYRVYVQPKYDPYYAGGYYGGWSYNTGTYPGVGAGRCGFQDFDDFGDYDDLNEPLFAATSFAKKAEPAKAEPAKAEPAKAEPAKAEPAKAEPAKAEPAKAEPANKLEADMNTVFDKDDFRDTDAVTADEFLEMFVRSHVLYCFLSQIADSTALRLEDMTDTQCGTLQELADSLVGGDTTTDASFMAISTYEILEDFHERVRKGMTPMDSAAGLIKDFAGLLEDGLDGYMTRQFGLGGAIASHFDHVIAASNLLGIDVSLEHRYFSDAAWDIGMCRITPSSKSRSRRKRAGNVPVGLLVTPAPDYSKFTKRTQDALDLIATLVARLRKEA